MDTPGANIQLRNGDGYNVLEPYEEIRESIEAAVSDDSWIEVTIYDDLRQGERFRLRLFLQVGTIFKVQEVYPEYEQAKKAQLAETNGSSDPARAEERT